MPEALIPLVHPATRVDRIVDELGGPSELDPAVLAGRLANWGCRKHCGVEHGVLCPHLPETWERLHKMGVFRRLTSLGVVGIDELADL